MMSNRNHKQGSIVKYGNPAVELMHANLVDSNGVECELSCSGPACFTVNNCLTEGEIFLISNVKVNFKNRKVGLAATKKSTYVHLTDNTVCSIQDFPRHEYFVYV